MKYVLRPVTCTPLTRDRDHPENIGLNDVLGNYSLTLIDSLSTLAVLASSARTGSPRENTAWRDFQLGVQLLVEQYGDGTEGPAGQGLRERGFDVDSKVQVFETVIRGVGGLLSSHLFAVGELPVQGYRPPERRIHPSLYELSSSSIDWPDGFRYDGQLLRLALDLGRRLLPAFTSPTGIPYPRVNLKYGIPFYPNSLLHADPEHGECGLDMPESVEITETCSAGAGSLVLELTTLSRLTGDAIFEQVAIQAFWEIWKRRTPLGLVGAGIDADSGGWTSAITGETSSDSFLEIWQLAHAAIKRHVYRDRHHPHYVNVHFRTGSQVTPWVDSLSAYYSGLLTLGGELDEAIESNLLYTALWSRFRALPERWSIADGDVEGGLGWWPGRPELGESTYHLYTATKDPWYLYVGKMILKDIKQRCWTPCGWAGLQDVRTGQLSDRMESFFLGETLKYLFLLFDVDHPLNRLDAPFVMSTEGHPLIVPRPSPGPRQRHASGTGVSSQTLCPRPPPLPPLFFSATAARGDLYHAAGLARLFPGTDLSVDLHSSAEYETPDSPLFPWTLPMTMVPSTATCSAITTQSDFEIQFPHTQSDIFWNPQQSISRVNGGIFVHSLEGIKLGVRMDETLDALGGRTDGRGLLRIHRISGALLAREEKVFMKKGLLTKLLDPNFALVEDATAAELLIAVDSDHERTRLASQDAPLTSEQLNSTSETPTVSTRRPDPGSGDGSRTQDGLDGVGQPLAAAVPVDAKAASSPTAPSSHIYRLPATTATGIGAGPLPDAADSEIDPNGRDEGGVGHLPWQTIYVSGETCERKLADVAATEHQVVVLRRGGCSFARKLANVPSFRPSGRALQLAVVVADGDERVRPLLDEVQRTPAGLARHHPIPLVLVGGGRATVGLLEKATAIGLRKRHYVQSQGMAVANLVVV
ncbi:MAG: alpha mannosidase-like protein [Phylliscum demangeonii]|nr:MAG: alpha mannosidase-like protein [Phylliscum demangeonii]